MPEMVPLRVDFELGGQMAVPDRHPMLLDGLLLAMTEQRRALPFAPDALPLEVLRTKAWQAGTFCWAASALQIDWVGPTVDRILHRNARPLELLQDAGAHSATSVDYDRGLTKVTRKRLSLRQAMKATAWCVGRQAEIEALLAPLQALGPHRHQGLGIVRSVMVTPDAAAGRLAWWRPLPAAHPKDPFKKDRILTSGRATPPYWDRDLSMQAWWPGLELDPQP